MKKKKDHNGTGDFETTIQNPTTGLLYTYKGNLKKLLHQFGVGPGNIRVANLPSQKLPNDNILTASKGYDATCGVKYEA
jgi:hypothetical protein